MSNKTDKITFTITGDFCPEGIMLKSNPEADKMLGKLASVFRSADINITNLECPLTSKKTGIRKSGPHLKAGKEAAVLLRELGFQAVTLANNHIMDYGSEGLNDTLAALSENGVLHTGAGQNLCEAEKPLIVEVKGKRVALLNFASHEFSIAGKHKAGANPVDVIGNHRQIMDAKAVSDYQIVIVHTGIEHYSYPTPGMQKLFRFYATLGVSAVVGHHSHCTSGYELYQGVPVFYGLGNFIFKGEGNSAAWNEGLVLQIDLGQSSGTSFKVYRVRQVWQGDSLVMDLHSPDLPKELNEDKVAIKWQEYLRESYKKRNMLNHLQRKGILSRALNRLFPRLVMRGIDPSYLNLLRNECNYEYLIATLSEIVEEEL
jgi:hypothetical protein